MSSLDPLKDLPVPAPAAVPPPVPADVRCTPQELRFIARYLQDQDERAAYREAVGKPDLSGQAAKLGATKWLARPRIAAQIQARLDRLLIAEDITAEKILREYARIGLADPMEIFEPSTRSGHFRFKPLDQWPESARRAVASVKVAKMQDASGEWVETVEVKWHPKVAALEALARRIESLIARTGPESGVNGAGGVHIQHANVLMYFPDNGRTPAGINPTNAPLAVSYRAPTRDEVDVETAE